MIVINRNPIDVIHSFALLEITGSHRLKIEQELHRDFPEFWNEWITRSIKNLKEDHDIVFNEIAL